MSNHSRRSFLRSLGKAGLGAALCRGFPLAGGMLATRQAHAQRGGPAIKRVVFVYTPNGAPKGLWLPNGNQLNLSTLALEGLQSVCNFREVEVVGSGHGLTRKCLGLLRWTQDWTSDTIDQQIAQVLGEGSPFRSYALGVQTNPQQVIGRRSGGAVPCQDDPTRAFEQLFSGVSSSDDGGESRRRSILDLHRTSLNELRAQLDGFERTTLEKHEQSLEELEARLAGRPSQGGACPASEWNVSGHDPAGPDPAGGAFALQAELQSDIMVTALSCGITPVMTLQLGWHQATWYGHDTQFRGDHHNSCHSAPAVENAEMTNYLSRCVAYLIRRLRDEEDPAVPGTRLLDNTVVVQVTDMGDGQDHSGDVGPSLVATRMPAFRQGTVRRGGTNLQVLETLVEGLGLGGYKGTDVDRHRIWPCADGQIIPELLT